MKATEIYTDYEFTEGKENAANNQKYRRSSICNDDKLQKIGKKLFPKTSD